MLNYVGLLKSLRTLVEIGEPVTVIQRVLAFGKFDFDNEFDKDGNR